jgi:hypothetical protein
MSTQAATSVGNEFLTALAERDFARLRRTLADRVRMRALIPTGPIELDGADAAAARFETWFGSPAAVLEVLNAASEPVGEVLHLTYRLQFDDHPMRPGDGPRVIEQHLFSSVEEGRIALIDLVCSGFRRNGVDA